MTHKLRHLTQVCAAQLALDRVEQLHRRRLRLAWSRLYKLLAPPLAACGLARTARLNSAPIVDPELCTVSTRHAQEASPGLRRPM